MNHSEYHNETIQHLKDHEIDTTFCQLCMKEGEKSSGQTTEKEIIIIDNPWHHSEALICHRGCLFNKIRTCAYYEKCIRDLKGMLALPSSD